MPKNFTILVTGAAGFIGARLVETLNRQGATVISVDDARFFSERAEHRSLDFGQIVDRGELIDFLEREKPALRAIFHMGACSDTTQLDMAYLRRVNLEYSQALWKYCTRERVPFIYASSGATYGGGELGYDDDESLIAQLKPLNPYGESKRLFDLWALEQERLGAAPVIWSGFKFFNVYGFGERHKGKMASVVLHTFDQIQKTGRSKLFRSHRAGIADGHQSRDFIYVDDVVDALLFALDRPISRGIYNLGTGQARTFLDLAKATFSALGLKDQIDFVDTPLELRERYQYFTEAKMDRLRAQGYERPFTSLEEGVTRYVQRLKDSR